MEQMVNRDSLEPQVKLRLLDLLCRRLVNGLVQPVRPDPQENLVQRDPLEIMEMKEPRLHQANKVQLDLQDLLDHLESQATLDLQGTMDNLAKT